ncbi:MAG: MBOAT family protein [Calditrichaeota bacterium]|nr:MBOAT family protein [Calditrichota bacterium]
MLFNSIQFAFFLPITFLLYWFVFNKSIKMQNFFLLAASYFFYGSWDWRFLSLIFVSSLCDYLIGKNLDNVDDAKKRKLLLTGSLLVNLGILGFFKYFNFFVDSFIDLFAKFGIHLHARSLQIILPVGISFYTFQTLSYTIDIYRRKIKPTNDVIAFFAFVSFFPQLVAGPIERAASLLPQFLQPRKFDYDKARDGMRQILWGLIKKIVVADTCANQVNYIFGNSDSLGGSTLLLGVIYFAFQIYGDFSGYSDIAIGTARLFGFNLMRNFALPYFSRDIAEFWRRWHISLSTWFRDYLYIPLGGSYGSKLKRIKNIIITFTVSGFWHGADWKFIFWGFLNGIYYIPLMLFNKQKRYTDIVAKGRLLPSFNEFGAMMLTFVMTLFAWIFFRAESMSHAISYIGVIFSASFFSIPEVTRLKHLIIVFVFVGIEWIQREKEHQLKIENLPIVIRWLIYLILWLLIILFFTKGKEFIYFQF